MNYQNIQKQLKDLDQSQVNIYLNYLKFLSEDKDRQGVLKNKWVPYQNDNAFVFVYKKVLTEGIFIDGETVTLEFRGKLMVSYNYQAYKNKVLVIYPNTLFDVQCVYKGDTFTANKISGVVNYKHEINDPFVLNRKIIGAYCVIKNKRGEFIETMNMDEINKLRNVASTKKIWDSWLSEMVKKSVIKRACKTHFKDLIQSIESIDNENYNLDNVNISTEIQNKISLCKNQSELKDFYDITKDDVKDEEQFLFLINEKAEQLKLAELHESTS